MVVVAHYGACHEPRASGARAGDVASAHVAPKTDHRPSTKEGPMIASEGIRSLRERLAPYGDQVVSLYLDVNPASPDNRRKAWALRARAALEALDLPKEASRRIAERLRLEVGRPDARTLVVFMHVEDEDVYESLEVDESLAPVEAAGGALARWGKPFLAPLELSTLRRRPSIALLLG